MARLPSQKAKIAQSVKTLHAKRREMGLCIYDARELGREPHAAPTKGGRCPACWAAKLESAKRKRREARQAA